MLTSRLWIGFFGALAILWTGTAQAEPSCLPQRRADLAQILAEQARAHSDPQAPKMVTLTRGSPRWMAAFNAVLAWENDDCKAFAAFAEFMGYKALEVLDTVSATHHWLLLEPADGPPGQHTQRWNGVFVLRAPAERTRARRLVITAPHLGSDFSDDRAARLYQKLEATALLLNSAERCNLESCSGCSSVPGYACGGCVRASDAAHSVDNLLFALFSALEGTRTHDGAKPWLHFEYHGMAVRPQKYANLLQCRGIAEISQGGTAELPAAVDNGSYPHRFFLALQKRLDPRCVCYHQRQRGCLLPGTHSVFGRLVNQESSTPFDPCTQEATRLSGRYIYFEWYDLPVDIVAGALAEAILQK